MDHHDGRSAGAPSHTVSTVALCACSLINAYLAISVFPYAGYMVMELMEGVDRENVGAYAGLIASSFMAGRTLSAFHWGKAADIYGRAFVLKSCLVLSAVFSLLFGTARSMRYALLWRFCLGLANGIISTAKTAATELADGDVLLERRIMGGVMGMRSWGYLVSPALGGLLAEPVRQYPGAAWLHHGYLLAKYPFLLPNLVSVAVCLLTYVIVKYFVRETLPESKRRDPIHIPADLWEWIRMSFQNLLLAVKSCTCPSRSNPESWLLLPPIHRETNVHDDVAKEEEQAESIWGRSNTRQHLLAHWMYAFVSMMVDEMFPLFCMSQAGGLGLTEASIGKTLSGAGLIFALCQYAVFAIMVHHLGEYTSLTIGSLLGIQPAALIPFSLLVNTTATQLSWSAFSLLSIIMGTCKIFGCLYFTSIALAINKTVPASQRGAMNGLVVTGASLTRSVAPTFAGALATFSFSSPLFPSQYGSILMYGTLSVLGLLVTLRVRHLNDSSASANGRIRDAT